MVIKRIFLGSLLVGTALCFFQAKAMEERMEVYNALARDYLVCLQIKSEDLGSRLSQQIDLIRATGYEDPNDKELWLESGKVDKEIEGMLKELKK